MQKNLYRSIILVLLVTWTCCSTSSLLAQNKKIDSLIGILDKEKNEVAKIPTLRSLSQSLTSVDPDKKYVYANQMRIISEKYKIDSIIPVAYLDMAMVFGIKTEYDSSMYYLTKGLAIAKEKGIKNQEARAYVGIGYTFDRQDNPQAAIENYELALKIFKKTNSRKGLNQTYINLGSLYFDLDDFEIAEAYFKRALKSFQEVNDESGIAYGYFILGNSSRSLNKDDEAYYYYNKSLAIREKTGDLNGIALVHFGLGELYLKQGKLEEATKSLKIAIANNQTLNNKYQETVALNTLSRVLFEQKNIAEARSYAQIALVKARELKSYGITATALEMLVDVEREVGNYKKALSYQSQAIVMTDSLNRAKIKKDFIYADFKRMRLENTDLETTNEVISEKNLTYQRAIYIISSLLLVVIVLLVLYLRKIGQKNRINKVLKDQALEISQINSQLESVNEELTVQIDVTTMQKLDLERVNSVKNKFFSIVSHDLRSPLATLKMLFNTYFSGQLSKDQMDDLLKKLEETIFNTADFLDNLLEWSKSQLEGIVIKAELFQIQPMLNRTLEIINPQVVEKNLKIENDVDENAFAFADKNMINVVLRNLISNSIKFCNAGDSIHISSVQKENSVLIIIKDSGVGIDPKEQNKIFQLEHSVSQGTSGEVGHHIGLVL